VGSWKVRDFVVVSRRVGTLSLAVTLSLSLSLFNVVVVSSILFSPQFDALVHISHSVSNRNVIIIIIIIDIDFLLSTGF